MLNFLIGRETRTARRAFLLIISFFILLFSVLIALLSDSISSFRVTLLYLGIGLFGINSGISSSISILSITYFFFSILPNRISSMLLRYLLRRASDFIRRRSDAARRTLLEMKKSDSS